MKAFVPSSLRDNAGAAFRSIRAEDDTFTPVTDHLRTAANMEARVALNLAGVPSSGLSGTTDAEREATIRRLEKEMKEASKMLEFEYAALLRDQIIALRGEK